MSESVTQPGDVLDVLEELVDLDEPVAGAVEIAEELPVGRRTVLSKLDVLEAAGEVKSKKVGRTRVFWPDPLAEPPSDPDPEPPKEHTSHIDPPADRTTDPPAEPPADPTQEPPADLADVVEAASESWQGAIAERREAAEAALVWLRDHGGAASATDVREALLPAHGVERQSEDTWWRKTVRPAYQEAQDRDLVEYRHGRHEYIWQE